MNTIKTKNSVVCTLAAKLAKHGVKNPMQAAWNIYNAVMVILHNCKTRNYQLAGTQNTQLRAALLRHDIYISDVLPFDVSSFLIATPLDFM